MREICKSGLKRGAELTLRSYSTGSHQHFFDSNVKRQSHGRANALPVAQDQAGSYDFSGVGRYWPLHCLLWPGAMVSHLRSGRSRRAR